jgi:general secretion pathway protein D
MRINVASATASGLEAAGLSTARCIQAAVAAFAIATAGCAPVRPYVPPSEGHITQPPPQAAAPEPVIPPPAKVSAFVPPPQPTVKPQTYSVVVSDVPVKELLIALARDTKQNIDIHPAVTGIVSLNAIDETLPAILERVSRQVNMRYQQEGNTIFVRPDSPYVKTYRVDYVNMSRDSTSTVAVTGEIGGGISGSASGGSGGSSGGASGAAGSNAGSSTTSVRTDIKNDFWDSLQKNLVAILSATLRESLTPDERAELLERRELRRELMLQDNRQVSGQADATVAGQSGSRPTEGGRAAAQGAGSGQRSARATDVLSAPEAEDKMLQGRVVVNRTTGTVTIYATERQHRYVEEYLTSVTRASQRQVLIEATILEVVLSNAYQGGVDWGRISQSAGLAFQSAMIGPRLAAAPFFALFYNQNNQRQNDISLTVKLLEQFGRTKVLSSPKLMALNNQTALLKVVTNLVYFEVQVQQGVVTTTGAVQPTTVNTTAKTVSEGVVMSVTPQINEDGRVTLTVRPTISDKIADAPDPNPMLIVANSVPVMRVREMESVLQVANGQTIVLGGLMQDRTRYDRDQLPVVGDVPTVGEAFKFRNELASKTELIIFLRPTVVENPSLESAELKFLQRFLPTAGGSAADRAGVP